tara:strand:+ start:61 stop:465 length:405 start_codon:yes stop_codon:yes gene_type:complete
MKLLVLHGPNMNLIGIRSSKCGDRMTLNKINTHIRKFIRDLNIEIKIMQTHNEVKAVSYLHRNRNKFDGIILIPGVWENSGYLLKETLEIISINYVLIYLEEGNKNVNLFKSKKYFSNKNILKSFEEAILNYVS